MEQVPANASLEDLLRHSRWMHALARHLTGEDADDVVQDVWVQTIEHPLAEVSRPRAWLARVLLNRARSNARSGQRRGRREVESASPTAAPSPDVVAERMEIQRLLAQLIVELPDPYRQVVYLRYVEDTPPTEIAKRLGVPAGTVRWRLSEALDRLRARLDERDGGRRRWLALLGARDGNRGEPGGPSSSPARFRLAPVAVFALSAGAALILAWSLWSGRLSQRETVGTGSGAPGSPGSGASRGHGLPMFATTTGNKETCPEVEPLRAFLGGLRRLADPWRDLRELYDEGAPNPRLEVALAQVIAGMPKPPEGCDHSISCRGQICDVRVMTPDGVKVGACHPQGGPEFRDRLSSGRNNTSYAGTPFFDPVKQKAFTMTSQLWRFQRHDAAPEPWGQRAPLPDTRLDFRRAPTPPRDLGDGCRAQWRALERELARLERTMSEREPDLVFDTIPADPGLTSRLTTWLRSVLDRPAGELPVAVDCRGQICALSDRAVPDPLAIKWHCPVPGSASVACRPGGGDSWFSRVNDKVQPFGRLRPPFQFPDKPQTPRAFLVLPPEDSRPSSWTALIAFMESFDWRAAVRTCEAQFPERGKLRFKFEVDETAGDEDPPHRVTLNIGGELGGTKLARCVGGAFETASARFTVPPISNGATWFSDVMFPFDPSAIETKLAKLRGLAQEQKHRPPF